LIRRLTALWSDTESSKNNAHFTGKSTHDRTLTVRFAEVNTKA
jgi:hypothetical protein